MILAKNQSRFSRNFLHIEQYLHRELPHLNIRFIGVTDGVDAAKLIILQCVEVEKRRDRYMLL